MSVKSRSYGKAEDNAKSMQTATLRVTEFISTAGGPVEYVAEFTRGGWIWRTSHRYKDWLALKEGLQEQHGKSNLPDEALFPGKQNVGDVVAAVLTSCDGCRMGHGQTSLLEERRQRLQKYFTELLEGHRLVWDNSEAVKEFFHPGPPTVYRAALARRASEGAAEAKKKDKGAPPTMSRLASFKNTLGDMLENTTSSIASGMGVNATAAMTPTGGGGSTGSILGGSLLGSTLGGSSAGSTRSRDGSQDLGELDTARTGPLPPVPPLGATGRASSMMQMLSAKVPTITVPSLTDILFNNPTKQDTTVAATPHSSSRAPGGPGGVALAYSGSRGGGHSRNGSLSSSMSSSQRGSGSGDKGSWTTLGDKDFLRVRKTRSGSGLTDPATEGHSESWE